VAVGDDPDTVASVRVRDQDGVADFLELLAEELASDWSTVRSVLSTRPSVSRRSVPASRPSPSTCRSTTERRPSK